MAHVNIFSTPSGFWWTKQKCLDNFDIISEEIALSVIVMEDFRNQTTYLNFMQAGVTDSDLDMACPIT